jgi:uncharacterized protein (TIGR03435 family)
MRLCSAVLVLAVSASAQGKPLTHPKPAPELSLSRLLQAPPNSQMTLASLRGKAVVLEFWATWCGGCVAQIPHLNALAAQFENKPVVFLSVTDEEPEEVEAFLKKRPMNSWIGIDKDGGTFRRYGIEGRPQTFLINKQGRLWGRLSPDRLNAARLNRLLAGDPSNLDAQTSTPKITPMEFHRGVPTPLLQVLIRPAAAAAVSGFSPGAIADEDRGRSEFFGMSLKALLAMTEHVREDRIVAPDWAGTARYDVSSVVPEGREQVRSHLLAQMLRDTFELQTAKESKPVTVFVLRCTEDCANRMHPSSAKPSWGFLPRPGQFSGASTDMSRLIGVVEHAVNGIEVIDQTGLSGAYQVELSWQAGDVKSLQAALRQTLGLALTDETQSREFLVVTSATQPLTW